MEFIMNAKQVIFTSVIALAAAGAMADDITIDNTPVASTVTRAQVKAEVLKARKAGELLVAGEGYPGDQLSTTSNVARAEVKSQVIAARAAGELLVAGEGAPNDAHLYATRSTLSRADVKAEVLAARKAGQLLPAGEAYPDAPIAQQHTVAAGNPFKSLAKVFHRDGASTSQ
jgi:hypothetical protein